MNSYFLNITPTKKVGFCNQLYAIAGTCCYSLTNNIRIVFISRYLKEIGTDEYCNIGEIIDIQKTNQNLSSYNIHLVDGYNFNFKIEKVIYGNNNNCNIDITSEFTCAKNKKLFIPANTNINMYKGDPYEHFKRQYFIDIKGARSLVITYSIDGVLFQQIFEVLPNGLLINNIDINYENLEFIETKMFCNDGSDIFRTFVRTIVFNDNIIGQSSKFIQSHIHPHQKVNAIHLRIEDDAIQHWGKESKFTDLVLYKKLVELRYIDIIKRLVSKDDLTILLASDYNNGVIDFMRDNNYNYTVTPKFSPYRDISAIIDMHIGQHCNNLCLGIWESSYSYAMFFRIFNKTNLTTAVLYLTNIKHQGSLLDNK
jgi:hypothetical protein